MSLEQGYPRENLKTELQALEQQISAIEAAGNPKNEDLNALHAKYEKLRMRLDETNLEQAA